MKHSSEILVLSGKNSSLMSFYNCCSCIYPEENQRINSLFALLSEREAGACGRIIQSEKLLINT